MSNLYNTYIAYRDNGSWTSERGASKFLTSIIDTDTYGVGDKGGVLNGFGVKAQNPTTMYVDIAASDTDVAADGHCVVSTSNYNYFCWLTANYSLQLDGASQSLSRISYIVAYVDKAIEFDEEDEEIESPSVLKFVEVKGTEADDPVPPTSAQIQGVVGQTNPYIILAEVSIPVNTSVITDALITDRRIFAKISQDKININEDELFVSGILQANNSGTRTKIVVTDANASAPAAISGVQIIWIKKKS